METRANYILIGAFTIIAAIASFIFAIWLANAQFDREFEQYDVYFAAPVRGLSVGGTVRFNGIPVGTVSKMELNPRDPKSVLVRVRIDASTPVRVDSIAQLEPEGLTGIAYVQISGGTPETPLLTRREGQQFPVIATRIGQLDRLFEGSEGVIASTLEALDGINRLLDEGNIAAISRAINNLERLTATLNRNEALLVNSNKAALALAEAGEEIATAAKTYDQLGQNLGSEVSGVAKQANVSLKEIEELSKSLRKTAEATTALANDSRRTAALLGDTLDQANNDTLPAVSDAAADLRRLSANLERVAAQIERNPSSFVAGEEKPTVKWK